MLALLSTRARVIGRFLHRRRVAFAITNTAAMTISIAMFSCAITAGASPHAATLLRLATALPILYVGYSRYMLADSLVADRTQLGRGQAELRMLLRVGIAIGASIGLKLAIEPLLTGWLLANTSHATIAPLVGDLCYGPLATYLLLNSFRTSESAMRPRAATLRAQI